MNDDRSPADPTPPSRRRVLTGLAALVAATGLPVPFAARFPPGMIPVALADEPRFPGKSDALIVHNDRPILLETPISGLDAPITATADFFVRNNGKVPEAALKQDASGWTLTVDGEVREELQLSLDDLKQRFEHHRYDLVLECGGNGRAGFRPGASGVPWRMGAVGCARWEGVRLADVLAAAGVKAGAVYVAYEGMDAHLDGSSKLPISRGLPLAKAMDPHTLLAWSMNGDPLPPLHGFPLRIVASGYPASASGKWLKRLWVRDVVHDGPKMTGKSYRVPRHPVAPGAEVPDDDMVIIEQMPVKSVITRPGTGSRVKLNQALAVRGQAWSGEGTVERVDVSLDFGATWERATLKPAPNPFAWQRWEASLRFPTPGYYEVWARATDPSGRAQPMVVGPWNPKGYLNNAMHRVAVEVVA